MVAGLMATTAQDYSLCTPQCLEFPRLAPEAGHPGQGDHPGEAVRRATLTSSPYSPAPSIAQWPQLRAARRETPNKTGVRLWTDCPLNQDRKISRDEPLGAIANKSESLIRNISATASAPACVAFSARHSDTRSYVGFPRLVGVLVEQI
jgi:hypothetical protein